MLRATNVLERSIDFHSQPPIIPTVASDDSTQFAVSPATVGFVLMQDHPVARNLVALDSKHLHSSWGLIAVEWIERCIDLGTPLLVLIVVLRMLTQCAMWTAKHFVLPLRDSWTHHLRCLDEHTEKQTAMLCEILKRVGTDAV